MPALPPTTDFLGLVRHVGYGPLPDIDFLEAKYLARFLSVLFFEFVDWNFGGGGEKFILRGIGDGLCDLRRSAAVHRAVGRDP